MRRAPLVLLAVLTLPHVVRDDLSFLLPAQLLVVATFLAVSLRARVREGLAADWVRTGLTYLPTLLVVVALVAGVLRGHGFRPAFVVYWACLWPGLAASRPGTGRRLVENGVPLVLGAFYLVFLPIWLDSASFGSDALLARLASAVGPMPGPVLTAERIANWTARYVEGVALASSVLTLLHRLLGDGARLVLRLSAPPFFVWSILAVIHSPGGMAGDSFLSWSQAHTWTFDDSHPVGYALWIRLVTWMWDYPTAVVWSQVLLGALAVGWSLAQLAPRVRTPVLLSLSGLLAVAPSSSLFLSVLKDAPFAAAIVFATGLMARLYLSRGGVLQERWFHVATAVAIVFATAVRHNGIALLPVLAVGIIALYRRANGGIFLRRGLPLAACACLLLWLTVNVVLRPTKHPGLKYFLPFHGIAAVVYHGGPLTADEEAFVETIVPRAIIEKRFHRHTIQRFVHGGSPELDRVKPLDERLAEDGPEVLRLWGKLLLRAPRIVLGDWADMVNLIWDPRPIVAVKPFKYHRAHLDLELHHPWYRALAAQHRIAQLENPLRAPHRRLVERSYEGWAGILFWRHGWLLALFVLFGIVFLVRDPTGLVVLLPVAANLGSLLVSMPAQTYRYVWPSFLCLPVIALCAWVASRQGGADGKMGIHDAS